MTRIDSTLRRALKNARHAYAYAVEQQADAVGDAAQVRAERRAVKAARFAKRQIVEAYRLADLADDFAGEF